MSSSAYYETVQKLYIAYYGRPADPGGLEAWCAVLEQAGGDPSEIIDAFANSPEAQARFGGLSPAETISLLYNQLFGRDPESQEIIDAWVFQLENNPDVTPQSIALELLNGAQNTDAQVVANRLAAAETFTQYLADLEADGQTTEYVGSFAAQHAANWLGTIMDDPTSLTEALDNLEEFVEHINEHARITVEDIQVQEADGVATLVLERTGGLYTETLVNFATEEGSANANDFSSFGGFAFFEMGISELQVSINVNSDDDPEGAENFFFNYSYDGLSSRATVTVIDDGNTAPNAVFDYQEIYQNLVPTSIDVLDNDSDFDDNDLTIIAINGHDISLDSNTPIETDLGALVSLDTGSNGLLYDLDGAAPGQLDSFTYTISDGNGGEDTATVYLNGTEQVIDFEELNLFPIIAPVPLLGTAIDNDIPYFGFNWEVGGQGFLTDEDLFILSMEEGDYLNFFPDFVVGDLDIIQPAGFLTNTSQYGVIGPESSLSVSGHSDQPIIVEAFALNTSSNNNVSVQLFGLIDNEIIYSETLITSADTVSNERLDWGAIDTFIVQAPSSDAVIIDDLSLVGLGTGFGPATLELSTLDGSNGLVFNGIDDAGYSVSSAGDINGDGFDDILIGAHNANLTGETYLVYGDEDLGDISSLDLSSLDGSNGFVLKGIDSADQAGESVSSAGDINNDGYDDILIGAKNAGLNAGETYLVFGGSNIAASGSLELSDLDGSASLTGPKGFVINGIDAPDYSGTSVSSAGDINGDGIDDILIGAEQADPDGNSSAGESYVIFGRVSSHVWDASLDLSSLDGTNGFVLNGIDQNDYSGTSVSSAGDINGDGIDDILIGANGADPDNKSGAGETYLVFGSNTIGASGSIDLSDLDGSAGLTGPKGFVINGVNTGDSAGRSVSSAGDINGDGFDDILIGADSAGLLIGESYVVFGHNDTWSESFDLSSLDGTNGFVLPGIDIFDRSAVSVSSAGDINNDGYDDILIGATTAAPNGNLAAGETYLIYGHPGIGASTNGIIDLSDLSGQNGFTLNGIDVNDQSGLSVSSAGDVDGDGIDDILIGAPYADSSAGEAYLVFGDAWTAPLLV
ncbi:Calx-beta domain-containing protein [Neptuniibacter sp.]|uniref:Calx-beta domain-containing protein n=1 Tax=Neptuniibacter sp. TaxID=1962643 RepID=UPI0026338194|nr:Calx-beta domain-containing protein [Neptuniibacter sp.]MCP4598068.1 hypothetical protein [Neptuniibacter sp.]